MTSSDNLAAIQLAQEAKAMSVNPARSSALDKAEAILAAEIQCLWYEFTPFEIGCDEVGGESICGAFAVFW